MNPDNNNSGIDSADTNPQPSQGNQVNPQQPTPTSFNATPPIPVTTTPIQQTPTLQTPPQPIGTQPAPYNPSTGGSPVKKIIIGIVAFVLILILAAVGYTVYKSMQYPEENKVSTAYIEALRDEDYDQIAELYDTELTEIIDREKGLADRMHAIEPSSVNPETVKEDEYKRFLTESKQDFDIPDGKPSRISADYYGDTDPKYIVSTYTVGGEDISVVLVYDSGKPKALFAKKGQYNDIKDFEKAYQEYKDALEEAKQLLDNTEVVIESVENQSKTVGGTDSLSAKIDAKKVFGGN
ncbi:MAG: hypothetical protein Q7T74_01365 [Candidatus Saccharibacteria bacterium]|nr:hypothetical protein [Candidatus Saccharibacteria bacterium]